MASAWGPEPQQKKRRYDTARVRQVSSPLAACGVVLVAIAIGSLSTRHRSESPARTPIVLTPPAPRGPLDLNHADAAALEALPRIGPSLARRIIEDRERNGPFHAVEDLERVRGIGPATLEVLRPLITIDAASSP